MVSFSKKNKVRIFKNRLNILLDIAQTINEEHSVDDLISEFDLILREELEVGKIMVFSHTNNEWHNLLTRGIDPKKAQDINVKEDLMKYFDLTSITMEDNEVLQGFDFIIPLYHKFKIIGYVLVGDIEEENKGISPMIKHIKLIQIISNLIIVFIENKRMQEELIRQESMKKEMELASKIQNMLVPDITQIPTHNNYKIACYYNPHQEVGGDYYDFVKLSDNDLGFCIADVSGKGMSAAILMSNFQAVFRALFTNDISLEKLIVKLNEKVNLSAKNEKFITMFLGKYNTETGKLKYVNAGHLPPLLYLIDEDKILELDDGCIGLGMLEAMPFVDVGELKINGKAKLLTFTDGLVEMKINGEVRTNYKPLQEALTNSSSIENTIDILSKYVEKNINKGFVFDDVSITAIELLI